VERETKDRLQKLMIRLADGDREAFDPIYQALWPVVRRFADRVLGGSPDAEDAAQVALMKVFSRISDFDRERDALSWVLGVTAYECKTFRQKQRRRREISADRAPADPPREDPTPEEAVMAHDLEAAAVEVLGTLRPADVETLVAVMNGNRPQVPGATFRKRVERAIVRLRAAWSSRHGLD
jgi:RNA polymerase sigma factor (sigma-70 family)